jgi:RHS repeat-associated protein
MYNSSGLVERALIRDMGVAGAASSCTTTVDDLPADDWRYRYNTSLEREQKRQYSSAMGPGTLLPWTYYILGPDNAQLGVWHGLQGSVNCDPTAPTDPTSVRMWPVEYNSYSVGGRVILRPDGRKELVVTNHLGSTVAVVEVSTPTAPVFGQQHTTAFGQPIAVKGAVDADRARTGYIGRETDAEHNLGAYGARLYSSAYGRFLAVDKLWEEFRHISPYAYSENNPVMLKDPTGEFPWGIVIGAAVEVASQMIFENRSVSEIDGGRVAIAATAGGLTGGLSAFSSATTRVVGAVAISVAEGAGKRAVSGEGTTVENVVVDGLIGAGAGKAAESIAKRALGSAEGQLAKDQLRRAENAVADGRPRPAQIARAEAAKKALDNVGRGPKQDVIISCAKEGADKFLQAVAPVKRDNTSVTLRPIPLKP